MSASLLFREVRGEVQGIQRKCLQVQTNLRKATKSGFVCACKGCKQCVWAGVRAGEGGEKGDRSRKVSFLSFPPATCRRCVMLRAVLLRDHHGRGKYATAFFHAVLHRKPA